MSEIDFKQVLSTAGVPVTEDAALSRLREIAVDEKAPFNNLSPYSPFGRLLGLLIVKPLMWCVDLLALEILPALYLRSAKGKWVDVFAWQLDLTRKPATKARGVITLTRYSADGTLAVPAGTVIQSATIANRIYRMRVVDAAEFVPGQTSLKVLCEAEETGSAFNLATGFYALVATALSGIASASNTADWLLTPGADEETDDELKARCRNQFTAINKWHIDAAYKSLAAEFAGIGIDDIYIEHDAPRGAGTANLYILSDEQSPAPAFFAEIQQHIMLFGNHGLGDDVQVMPMPTRPLTVFVRVRLAGWLSAGEREAVAAEIQTFIRIALRAMPAVGYSPTRVLPNSLFVWSNLMRELHDVFPSLVSVDFVGTDEDLQTELWIPQLGTLALEVMA